MKILYPPILSYVMNVGCWYLMFSVFYKPLKIRPLRIGLAQSSYRSCIELVVVAVAAAAVVAVVVVAVIVAIVVVVVVVVVVVKVVVVVVVVMVVVN